MHLPGHSPRALPMTSTCVDGVPFSQAAAGRRLEDLSANELRMKLYNAGIEYPDDAGKKELIELVKKYC